MNGGMAKECIRFYKRLSEMIADKRKAPVSIVTKNVRTLISFSLLRSTIRCIRGSRSLRNPALIDELHINNYDDVKQNF